MHAESIVVRFVEQALAPIHGARRRVLVAVAWVAMCGSVVSLSRLARHGRRRSSGEGGAQAGGSTGRSCSDRAQGRHGRAGDPGAAGAAGALDGPMGDHGGLVGGHAERNVRGTARGGGVVRDGARRAGGSKGLSPPRPRSAAQSGGRSPAQCPRAVGAGALDRPARPANGRDRGAGRLPAADRGGLPRHQVAGLGRGDRDRLLALGPAPSSAAADRDAGGLPALAPGATRESRRHGQAQQGDHPHHARAVDRRAGDPAEH
jgi:hypothetical protein